MRVAVTGASGFVGGAVAVALAKKGHEVFAFGRRPAHETPQALPNYAQWDIEMPLERTPDVDALVHCAARVGDWGRDFDYQRTNVGGTQQVLDVFKGVGRIIHISSASVYSRHQDGRHLSETASTGVDLLTPYARSKADAEAVLLSCRPDAAILRPHIVYGPSDTTLMPRVIAALRFGCLAIPGDGKNTLSVTHILNLTDAVECALERRSAAGHFNISDAEPVQVDELLGTLLRREGREVHLLHVPRRLAWILASLLETVWRAAGATHAPSLTRYMVQQLADGHTLNLSRATNLLGYDPRYDYQSFDKERTAA